MPDCFSVTHNGQEYPSLYHLARAFDMSYHTLRYRWIAARCPKIITDAMVAKKHANLTLDGRPITLANLIKKTGRCDDVVRDRIRRFGNKLTTTMFTRGYKTPSAKKPKPTKLASIPGPSKWELENLSHVGQNGFSNERTPSYTRI